MKKTRGFTLIELLVVIAIIGILSSVVLVSLSGTRTKARTVAFKQEVSSLHPRLVDHCDSNPAATLDAATVFGFAAFTTFAVGNVAITEGTCAGDNFTITITPSAGNGGTCTSSAVKETGTTFTGC